MREQGTNGLERRKRMRGTDSVVRWELVYSVIGAALGAAFGGVIHHTAIGFLAGAFLGIAVDSILYLARKKRIGKDMEQTIRMK